MNGLKLNSPKLQNVSEFKWKLLKVPELCSFLLQLQKISTLMEHLSFVCFYNSELFDLYFASSLKKKIGRRITGKESPPTILVRDSKHN